jgi:hypothetical protein
MASRQQKRILSLRLKRWIIHMAPLEFSIFAGVNYVVGEEAVELV